MNCNRETENTCVPWHNPEKLHSLYDNNDEVTTFCVIRSPLERLLSIFKYNNGGGQSNCTVEFFNGWTENMIHRLKNDETPPMMCHLLQQTSYPCERKLLFENLATEFDALMAEFGMNITLSDSNAIHERSSKTCGNLKASDLFPKVHTLVSKHYASDLSLHTKLLEERSMGRSVENSVKPKNNSVASATNTAGDKREGENSPNKNLLSQNDSLASAKNTAGDKREGENSPNKNLLSQNDSLASAKNTAGDKREGENSPNKNLLSQNDSLASAKNTAGDKREGENSPNKNLLSFIHIPGTTGIAIEKLGFKGGLTKKQLEHWGLFTFCGPLHDDTKLRQWMTICRRHYTNGCAPWNDPEKLHAIYDNYDNNVHNITTFCVIQSPFERLLSTFKYNNGLGRNNCDSSTFNNWAREMMPTLQKPLHLLPSTRLHPLPCTHLQNTFQQSSYPCQRMLLFENLEIEFNILMKEFDLGVTLGSSFEPKFCSNLTPSDLLPEVRALVSAYYPTDLSLHKRLLKERSIRNIYLAKKTIQGANNLK